MARTFYIIDGHAQIFRAYFAPFRELSSPTGEPTKAVFVFLQTLFNLIERRRPDYLVMCADSGTEKLFRRQLDPTYKANRTPPPDDFHPQAQRILEMVQLAGIPLFRQEGAEADDLIATLARRLKGQNFEVVIVSKDKDLRQLIDEATVLYDVNGDERIDLNNMAAKCGFMPPQAIDIQTLTGDATDNVLGIPGVGEKTAIKLLNQYGGVDNILAHVEELTPKMRENFKQYAPRLALARQLVTLKNDVEMEFSAEACRFQGLNAQALRPHFQALGFEALLKKLDQVARKGDTGNGARSAAAASDTPSVAATTAAIHAPPKPDAPAQSPQIDAAGSGEHFSLSLFGDHEPARSATGAQRGDVAEPAPTIPRLTGAGCDYQLINTPEKFDAFFEQLSAQKRFAFDTETTGLDPMRAELVGMSFSWKAGQGFYLPLRGPAGATVLPAQWVLGKIGPLLEDASIAKIGHNIKYDWLVMRNAGVQLCGIVMDTMIAAFLAEPGRFSYGIDRLALDLLGFAKVPTSDLIGTGKNQITMDRVSLETICAYAAEDADIAWRLGQLMRERLQQLPLIRTLHEELETPLIEVLAQMEYAGVSIDPLMLRRQGAVLGERIVALRERIMSAAGTEFNPDSPKQLGEVLFSRLGLKVVKRTKTGPSTDVQVLEKLALEHAVPKLVLEYRSLVKLKNTYIDNLEQYINPRTGRIHATFNQIGAATGRLSCSDPNLQNIPIRSEEGRAIRLAFVPRNPQTQVLLTVDYSQIELRVLAHFTQEPALLRAFDADEDIHRAVAAEVFGVPLEQVDKNQRGQAKTINFGIVYGVSAFGLARRIEGLTVAAAQKLIDDYARRFPAIQIFLNQCVEQARTQGYVQTIMGRRRPINDINSPVLSQRNAAERMAINTVVQGSAADLIKQAMLNVARRIERDGLKSKMLLQVHDELVFETPAELVEAESQIIGQEMTGAMRLKVPLKVEAGWGANWQEGK